MSDMAEDRVYDADRKGREAFLATGIGVVRVAVSGERVGEFGMAPRCTARDVTAGETVAVATDEDVLVRVGEGFEPTGFGPATAVGLHEGRAVAAGEEGRVGVYEAGEWHERDEVDTEVRAIDGDLLATARGVYRLAEGGIEPAGLEDANDVSASGVPLAATGRGLYELGNGWLDALEGDFRVAARGGDEAHAATPSALYELSGGEWEPVDLPVEEAVVDVDYGGCPYAVTEDGTLLTGEGEWRAHPIGVEGVLGIAVR